MKKILVNLIFLSFCFVPPLVSAQQNISFVDSAQATMHIQKDLDTVYRAFLNTSISILPPKYFVEFSSDKVSGFMHTGTAANIVAFEYNQTPYLVTADTLKQEHLIGQNVTLIGEETVKTNQGFPGKLYFAQFKVDNIDIIRIMFFTGDYNKTVFLQANYPLMFDPLIRQVIIQSFLSVQFK